ncbi:MAG: helix-turn-helix transcriptional regulator [Bacteroidales bacterium]|nr:helix-turn-helix transcriptional regulator [Bacteroidales bacterium]
MATIGSHIKNRRKHLKISQRQLAELSGVGINTLTKIERGEANPTLSVLNRILDTLGLELTVSVKTLNDEGSNCLQ